MVKTHSSMLPLGTVAPKFCLQDVITGGLVSLDDKHAHQATVVMFICNHCPFVKHILSGIISVATHYASQPVRWIAINANDITQYPDDAPAQMKSIAEALQFPFPYLFDETQEVAQAYHATCTPDFFVFDHKLHLVYRGQFDDARPGNSVPVTGESIQHALACLLAGQAIDGAQKPSLGCNIKWKEGQEPLN